MTSFSRCLPGIAILLSIATPALACDQEHQRDAVAHPCALRDQLAVTQDSRGFIITRREAAFASHPEPTAAALTVVQVGATQKIDKSIFLTGLGHRAEKLDADR